jgi:proline racemase
VSTFPESVRALDVVDSHTEGEPTRVVIGGWPQPAGATMAERRAALLLDQDALRRAVVGEPRGHEAVVGALLTPPVEPGSQAGVVFFDNAGGLGMCGHGTIGVVRTLKHLGRLRPGRVRLDTPVCTVAAELHDDGGVTIENVPARVHALDVELDVPGVGRVKGDVAWGGNWFFLAPVEALGLADEMLELRHVARLTQATAAVRRALTGAGLRGDDGAEIDHVEVFGRPRRPDADSRNFVLCPGFAYDRSPCGTGTSAKLAVLHARGQRRAGESWRQESITGGLFTGWIEEQGGRLLPRVRGRAFVTARATLLFDPGDPLRHGFGAPA